VTVFSVFFLCFSCVRESLFCFSMLVCVFSLLSENLFWILVLCVCVFMFFFFVCMCVWCYSLSPGVCFEVAQQNVYSGAHSASESNTKQEENTPRATGLREVMSTQDSTSGTHL
jgi:hypothetical protein